MTLRITNPTQNTLVLWFIDPNEQPARVLIPAGSQTRIGQGWSKKETKEVIKQLKFCGIRLRPQPRKKEEDQ